jgi:hypothetical protein
LIVQCKRFADGIFVAEIFSRHRGGQHNGIGLRERSL